MPCEIQKVGAVAMSGGRFDYNDGYLDDIASELECDIETNDNVEHGNWNSPDYVREGNHSSERTVHFMRRMVNDLHRLGELLHAYDWYVCGDTNEEDFIECAEKIYGECE